MAVQKKPRGLAQCRTDRMDYLVDRYSERKESAEELSRRVNLLSAVNDKPSN